MSIPYVMDNHAHKLSELIYAGVCKTDLEINLWHASARFY